MVLQILLCRIDLEYFLMVAMRMSVLVIFILIATFATMVIHALGSPNGVDQVVRLLFPGILVLVLLLIVTD
jgi:SNF family Na+-dependent transporter